jgi:hypothetical protein
MSIYAGQSAKSRWARPSWAYYGLAARSADRALSMQPCLKLCPAIPTGPCVGNDPARMADRFCLAVLLMPTFGKSAAGYQVTVPCFLGAMDDQHASPVGVAGLARIPGSNHA